jgi:alpha-N-arabinofuranosidase
MHTRMLRAALLTVTALCAATTAAHDHRKVSPMPSTVIRIRPPKPEAPSISPMQYGQFIEYLCDLVPGMWAEKLDDGGFEGLSPYAFTFLKETDWKGRAWYPIGAVNRSQCVHDEEAPAQGSACMRISVADGAPCTVGIAQDGIAVRRGVGCRFECMMQATDLREPVRVALCDGRGVLAEARFRPNGEWERYAAHLTPVRTHERAVLTIEFRGPGTVRLDAASLMPDDAVGGWRRDVVDALRALRPGIVRFGGSVVDHPGYGDYDWRKTIGPTRSRTPFRAWGGVQPAGAGLEEIVQLIQGVGAEPLLCVRFNGSAPEEAAAQVEYFNGATSTPMGALRARHGHARPYAVRYWQIGNEVGSEAYDGGIAAFARAMKRADPSISLLASYPTPGVLRSAGALLDYVCPHHYACDDLAGTAANIEEVARMIREHAPGRDIKIAVTEWNTTAGDWGPTRARLWTLANALACARYHNLLHRNAGIVKIANRSNLTNSFCSGIIQTRLSGLYKTPTYYAQTHYATRSGTTPLEVEGAEDSGLDVSATLTARGGLTVFVVNDTLGAVTATLDASALGARAQRTRVTTLSDSRAAGEPDVTNSPDDPERVVPERRWAFLDASGAPCTFPPLSLTVLEWGRATRSY